MRWLGPVVDRDDAFAPFLTAHLPVPAVVLRRITLLLLLAGVGVALGVVVEHGEQVQLAGVSAAEVAVYLVLVDLPTRRLHRYARVGAGYVVLHLLSTVALIAWTWLLPLTDRGSGAHLRAAAVLAGLRGDPHPGSPGTYRALAWACFTVAVLGGVALHAWIHRLGRAWAARPGS